MRRTTGRKASPVFESWGFTLPPATVVELLTLLGHGRVDLLQESVEQQFPGMKVVEGEAGTPVRLIRNQDAGDAVGSLR